MPDILHRVGMRGSADEVYQAIATTDGLSHWWITGTTGDTRVGGLPPGFFRGLWLTSSQIWMTGSLDSGAVVVLHRAR